MTPRLRQLLDQESWTQRELREIRELTYEHHERYGDEEKITYTSKQSTDSAEQDIFPRDTGLH